MDSGPSIFVSFSFSTRDRYSVCCLELKNMHKIFPMVLRVFRWLQLGEEAAQDCVQFQFSVFQSPVFVHRVNIGVDVQRFIDPSSASCCDACNRSREMRIQRTQPFKGISGENEFHICVRVCGVEGRGKSLSGLFLFVCEKDDRGESSTKSLGGMARPKDEMGSQLVSSESDTFHPILVYRSRNNNSQAQARRFPALTAPEPEFSVIFGSK